MTPEKSSPLPWRIAVEGTTLDGQIWIEYKDGEICRFDSTTDQDQANAALIVASVNNVQRLADALGEMVRKIERDNLGGRYNLTDAQAALNDWREEAQ